MARYCPRCKNELQMEDDKFCRSCGSRINPSTRSEFLRGPAPRWALILIIIIAIVLVFLVMTMYIVLSRGFFPREAPEGWEIPVYRGVHQTAPAPVALEVLGNTYGFDTSGGGASIDLINFTVDMASRGDPVDMTMVGMVLYNGSVQTDLTGATPLVGNTNPGPDQWAIVRILPTDLDESLDFYEVIDITVRLAPGTGSLSPGDRFTLELAPPGLPPLFINGTVPSRIDPVTVFFQDGQVISG